MTIRCLRSARSSCHELFRNEFRGSCLFTWLGHVGPLFFPFCSCSRAEQSPLLSRESFFPVPLLPPRTHQRLTAEDVAGDKQFRLAQKQIASFRNILEEGKKRGQFWEGGTFGRAFRGTLGTLFLLLSTLPLSPRRGKMDLINHKVNRAFKGTKRDKGLGSLTLSPGTCSWERNLSVSPTFYARTGECWITLICL